MTAWAWLARPRQTDRAKEAASNRVNSSSHSLSCFLRLQVVESGDLGSLKVRKVDTTDIGSRPEVAVVRFFRS